MHEIKNLLIKKTESLEPKRVFQLTDIYNDGNNKVAGKILYDLWKKNEISNIEYIGYDSSNHKWYVKKLPNQ